MAGRPESDRWMALYRSLECPRCGAGLAKIQQQHFNSLPDRVRERKTQYNNGESLFPRDFEDVLTEEKEIRTLSDFEKWREGFGTSWCFRGQADRAWLLQASYQRTVTPYSEFALPHGSEHAGYWPCDPTRELETQLHREALDVASRSIPDIYDWDVVDQLAVFQHHGVPTRLLDWTHNPYVALYFALEGAEPYGKSAAWAIDLNRLELGSIATLARHCVTTDWRDRRNRENYVRGLFLRADGLPNLGEDGLVISFEPRRVFERMKAQEGCFLCDLSLLARPHENGSVSVNLWRTMGGDPTAADRPLKRIILAPDANEREAILNELKKKEIDQDRLFPGPDYGSLKAELKARVEAKRLEFQERLWRSSTD